MRMGADDDVCKQGLDFRLGVLSISELATRAPHPASVAKRLLGGGGGQT